MQQYLKIDVHNDETDNKNHKSYNQSNHDNDNDDYRCDIYDNDIRDVCTCNIAWLDAPSYTRDVTVTAVLYREGLACLGTSFYCYNNLLGCDREDNRNSWLLH